MARGTKFTEQDRLAIMLELLSRKESFAAIRRKWDISETYAYKLRDRALQSLRESIGRSASGPILEVQALRRKVAELERLCGEQALTIRQLGTGGR